MNTIKKKEYYEQSVFWNKDYFQDAIEKERIEEIIKVIPFDIGTVLDVGCGNGSFVNSIINLFPNRFDRIMALDSSKEALKYVKTEKSSGSISSLPFKNGNFDLVTCLEVLEHLPQECFKSGISEIQRVSKKYIIITVPNNQDLENSLVMCHKCYCWFNPYFHIRSFDEKLLINLFENFKLIKNKKIGPIEYSYSYNRLLFTCYRTWRKPISPETSICPQCGYQKERGFQKAKNDGNFSHLPISIFKTLIRLISPKKEKKRWLLALYEKR